MLRSLMKHRNKPGQDRVFVRPRPLVNPLFARWRFLEELASNGDSAGIQKPVPSSSLHSRSGDLQSPQECFGRAAASLDDR